MASAPLRVGLVLGAGGLTGHAYHVGVLGAVEDVLGIDVRDADVIAGTSAGAGVGALLRAGLSVADLRARAEGRSLSAHGQALAAGLPASERDPLPPFRWPSGRPRPGAPTLIRAGLSRPWQLRVGHVLAGAMPEGRVSGAPFQALHDHFHCGRRWPDRPLWITAVRVRDGARVVFGRDPSPSPSVGTAVAASSAIPGYFTPVEIEGERYVDGGAHSPTQPHLVGGLDLDVIVVSSPMSARPGRAMAGATGWHPRLVGRPWHHVRLGRELAALRRRSPDARILVFEPTPADLAVMGRSAMDPRKMAGVAVAAEASAQAALARAEGRRRGGAA